MLSPYDDKPDLAQRIMMRNNQGEMIGDGTAKKLKPDKSPSQNYFPSHMTQTLNSLRRQNKNTFEKNSETYA